MRTAIARPHRARSVAAFAAFIVLAAAALGPGAAAQARDVDEVLAALEASAAAVVDLSFVLEGQLIDADGQLYALEVEVLALPEVPAAGLYIIQPDAIADNQVIVEGDEVRSYTYLTNQVSVFDIDDPDAFGGLIDVEADGALPTSLDLAAVFEGWDASLVDEEDTEVGTVVTIRFDNLDPDAQIAYVLVRVLAGTWDPLQLTFFRDGDELFADLHIRGLVRDQGLTLEDVTYLPDDAEVLDRRR
jgi:outer membrane lipoprotein-sorting protein